MVHVRRFRVALRWIQAFLRRHVGNACETVIIAFCGTDGSLLDVPQPRQTEHRGDIRSILEPLLLEIQQVRTEIGCSPLESQPVFHATDSFHKHVYKQSILPKPCAPSEAHCSGPVLI